MNFKWKAVVVVRVQLNEKFARTNIKKIWANIPLFQKCVKIYK